MRDLIAILQHIEKRPGMYFGGGGERTHSIFFLQAFILGFQTAQQSRANLDFFTEWVAAHYHVLAETKESFTLILEHVGGDERKAYDEFFRLLPIYSADKLKLGKDGILSKFTQVQDECWEAFKKGSAHQ